MHLCTCADLQLPGVTYAYLTSDDILIASCRTLRSLGGEPIGQFARERGTDAKETVLVALEANEADVAVERVRHIGALAGRVLRNAR